MAATEIDLMLKNAGLNQAQKKFCKIPYNKDVRLLAPAGSGKTYSLLWRCKYIHEISKAKELPVPKFLLVAFTRSAKQEIEERLKSDEFGDMHVTVRTLNAWGWEQIKGSGNELNTTHRQRQSIINHDLVQLIKKFPLISSAVSSAYGRTHNATLLIDLIDELKSMGFKHTMTRAEYRAHLRYLKDVGLLDSLNKRYEELLRIEKLTGADPKEREAAILNFFDFWKKAVIQIEGNNRYTLEDQKYWARVYFERQLEEGKYAQGAARYTHIMVDEFQDINPLDMALLNAACAYHSQGKTKTALTIIGDDDQAIFGWRGTSPQYILQPDKYFGRTFTTCVLETNYRSPKQIVEVSSKLLSYNKQRVPKEMRSVAKGKATIKVENKKKLLSSIDYTVKLAQTLVEKKNCRSVALIGRRQASLFPYQVIFSSQNISYHVDSDIDIFDGEAMKSLQNIIQIIYRAKDNDVDDPITAILDICDKIEKRQLSSSDKKQIEAFLAKQKVDSFSDGIRALRMYQGEIKGISSSKICKIIEKLLTADTVYKFMKCAVENLQGLGKDFNKRDIDNHYKDPQFERLTEISRRYAADFRGFYRDIEKARKSGERGRMRMNDDSGEGYNETKEIAYHLITATRSKGHEYDAVIVLNADASEWPNHLSADIEEERRLFYVALSRAKKYLYFVSSEEALTCRFLLEAGLV
ncbi:MAG: ATP-dependent helicase [Oscillospiraceae bacterium]|nr:ATP-dependent helicase [Oscillospiraceae bacterium]